jgi:hypothetical protein
LRWRVRSCLRHSILRDIPSHDTLCAPHCAGRWRPSRTIRAMMIGSRPIRCPSHEEPRWNDGCANGRGIGDFQASGGGRVQGGEATTVSALKSANLAIVEWRPGRVSRAIWGRGRAYSAPRADTYLADRLLRCATHSLLPHAPAQPRRRERAPLSPAVDPWQCLHVQSSMLKLATRK